jgi:hypothetical protein
MVSSKAKNDFNCVSSGDLVPNATLGPTQVLSDALAAIMRADVQPQPARRRPVGLCREAGGAEAKQRSEPIAT